MYALVFGVTLIAVGIVGFAVNSEFNAGTEIDGDDLIIFEVNGWHNIVHLASGALGVALAGTPAGGRAFALGFGAVYGAVTVWGFITGDTVFALMPVNTADNILHLAIAGAGLVAGILSPPAQEVRAA